MPVIEIVWRHLLVGARDGQRRWPSVTALAGDLGVGVSTAHRSLAHPVEIGAIEISSREGLVVLDAVRLLVLFCAHRRVQRDVIRRLRVSEPAEVVEASATGPAVILGGFGAVTAHLGANRIADYETVLFYGEPALPDFEPAADGKGTEILIAEPDRLLLRYGNLTPLAQAYADLFSLPGWQAARFVDELDPRTIAERDQPVLLV